MHLFTLIDSPVQGIGPSQRLLPAQHTIFRGEKPQFPVGNRTRNPSKRAAADLRLRAHGHPLSRLSCLSAPTNKISQCRVMVNQLSSWYDTANWSRKFVNVLCRYYYVSVNIDRKLEMKLARKTFLTYCPKTCMQELKTFNTLVTEA